MRVNISLNKLKKMIDKGVCFVNYSETYVSSHLNTNILEHIPFGVYSTNAYKKGDVLRSLTGEMQLHHSPGSIYIGNDMYVIDNYGRHFNNSDSPNIIIKYNKVIALKDINKKYKHYENLYEESMDSLAHMSDNDVSHLFANTFK